MIPDINLLPKIDKSESNSKLLYGIIAVATLLVLTLFSWQFFNAKSEINSLTSTQQSLQNEMQQLQIEFDALANKNTSSLVESVAFVERVSYPVSPILDETQRLLTNNSYLRDYKFDEDSTTILVDFESLSDVASYINRLEQSKYFEDVQIGEVNNFEINPIEAVGEANTNEETFKEIPRYSAEITLKMDKVYLATGGMNE